MLPFTRALLNSLRRLPPPPALLSLAAEVASQKPRAVAGGALCHERATSLKAEAPKRAARQVHRCLLVAHSHRHDQRRGLGEADVHGHAVDVPVRVVCCLAAGALIQAAGLAGPVAPVPIRVQRITGVPSEGQAAADGCEGRCGPATPELRAHLM